MEDKNLTGNELLKANAVRILIFGYKEFSQLIGSLTPAFADRAQFKIVDAIVGSVTETQQYIDNFNPDVVVSAGSNAAYLKTALELPVVALKTTESDIISAITKASKVARHVILINFSGPSAVVPLLAKNLEIHIEEHNYRTADQARELFHIASQQSNVAIVGASLVCGLAKAKNIPSFLLYSEASCQATLIEAVRRGMQWQQAQKDQALLSWLLKQSKTPIIMTDEAGASVTLNQAARTHLKLSPDYALDLDTLLHPQGQRVSDGECEINGNEWWFHLDTVPLDSRPMYVYQLYRKRQDKPANKSVLAKSSELIYRSDAIASVVAQVGAFSTSPSNVLVFGESGTGKELVARAIYECGPYANGQFVALNCSAIPTELFEGELFGHQDGAYTGSKRGGRKGLIEEAQHGVLFLDEISELALDQQAKLLRFLQERRYRPLGGNQERDVDLKLVAASNRPLKDMVISGEFREDLFFRLNVFNINIPPLRQRPEDIELIAKHKLRDFVLRYQLSETAEKVYGIIAQQLESYQWPGNIRELENVLERAVAWVHTRGSSDDLLAALKQISPELFTSPTNQNSCNSVVKLKEQEMILDAMQQLNGDRRKVAEYLGVSQTTLWRRLKVLNNN